jgi:Fe-S-cluster-containing hydrogenase component 2
MPAALTEQVNLNIKACSPYRKRSACTKCADVCPVEAISFESGNPEVSEKCFGCGICAVDCPVGAIDVQGFGEAADLSPREGHVVVECSRVPFSQVNKTAVRVPCLGGLTVSHLLSLRLSAGDSPIFLADRGWCTSCPAGAIKENPASLALLKLKRLFDQVGLPQAFIPALRQLPLAQTMRNDSAARGGLSRRGLFRRLGTVGSGIQSRTPVPAAMAQTVPILRAYQRQMSLLRRLSDKYRAGSLEGSTPFVTISGGCRDHGACAAHCPTEALKRWVGESDQGLTFDEHLCIECGLCVTACPHDAVGLSRRDIRGGIIQRETVTSHPLAKCRQCGAETTNLNFENLCARCVSGVGMLRTLLKAGKTLQLHIDTSPKRECHEHA